MSPPPLVSVILAAYQSDRVVEACLTALGTQTHGNLEIILVNSTPGDRTRQIVESGFPQVRLVESQVRLLPHAARNLGATRATGSILVFSDADCRGAPSWIEKLVEAQSEGHDVVCGAIDFEGSGWLEKAIYLCKFSFRSSGLPPGRASIVGTANACYSRRAWESVGPFDGSRFAGDALLGWRAAQQGFEPWFAPDAIVRHRSNAGFASFWRERWERGSDFADARVRTAGWSRLRLLGYLVTAPLLPWVSLARGAREALQCGHGRDFAVTAPVQLLGHLAWSLGEARAHLGLIAGRGDGAGGA